jgi:hypothetical protein
MFCTCSHKVFFIILKRLHLEQYRGWCKGIFYCAEMKADGNLTIRKSINHPRSICSLSNFITLKWFVHLFIFAQKWKSATKGLFFLNLQTTDFAARFRVHLPRLPVTEWTVVDGSRRFVHQTAGRKQMTPVSVSPCQKLQSGSIPDVLSNTRIAWVKQLMDMDRN